MRKALALVAVLAAAGCAGGPVREEAVAAAPGDKVVELHAKSYAFDPARLAVPGGVPLVFRISNEATVIPHSFVLARDGGGIIVRRTLRKGGETVFRIPALEPGSYTFYCDESFMGTGHREKGMEGKLLAAPPQ